MIGSTTSFYVALSCFVDSLLTAAKGLALGQLTGFLFSRGVLCAAVVKLSNKHRDTENTEVAQKKI